VGTDFLHSDGRTHITKLIFAFHNIANAPKIVSETEKLVDNEDWNSVVYFKYHA
jgi:hypothetical protein